MEALNNENTITINDIWLASYLRSMGFKIVAYSKNKRKLLSFVFAKDDKIEEHIRQFLNGEAQVNVKKFIEEYRSLHSLCF